MSDFWWHPGFKITSEQKRIWLEGCYKIYSNDDQLIERLNYCLPIYGLRWSLIMLNLFLRNKETKDWKNKSQLQLIKSKNLLIKIQEDYT